MDSAADIIRRHLNEDVHALAVQEHWYQPFDKQMMLRQIQSRQKAKSKLPSWYGNLDLLFPSPLSVEQCSSELTAAYKASCIQGELLVDMTGGMGVDSCAFASRFSKVMFIERQPELAETARHNFKLLGIENIHVVCGDSVAEIDNFDAPDWVFLDPSRRKEGKKVFLLEDCEPDVPQIIQRLWRAGARNVLLKLSPLLDIKQLKRTLPGIHTLHIVSVHHEVKELLLEVSASPVPDLQVICVNLESQELPTIWQSDFMTPSVLVPVFSPDTAEAEISYLYEPHPTIMKAGLMDLYVSQFEMCKLHKNSHLYFSSQWYKSFFGRVFKVEKMFGMGKSELKNGLMGLTKANITLRNFPMKEQELRKKLKLADGGEVTLIATTLQPNKHVLIWCHAIHQRCEKDAVE